MRSGNIKLSEIGKKLDKICDLIGKDNFPTITIHEDGSGHVSITKDVKYSTSHYKLDNSKTITKVTIVDALNLAIDELSKANVIETAREDFPIYKNKSLVFEDANGELVIIKYK